MLGPVRGVGEGLVAALVLTHIWLLPGVGPEMGFEVLQTRVGLGTSLKLGQTERQTEEHRQLNLSTIWWYCYFQNQKGKASRFNVLILGSLSRAHTLWQATQKKQSAVPFLKKRLFFNEISKQRVRCGEGLLFGRQSGALLSA